MDKINIRHGDLGLFQIDQLPENLKKSEKKVLMTGSNNNDHIYENGEFYPLKYEDGNFVVGYFIAKKNTKLFHAEHGEKIEGQNLRVISVPPGIYELRKQYEETHEGMRKVID